MRYEFTLAYNNYNSCAQDVFLQQNFCQFVCEIFMSSTKNERLLLKSVIKKMKGQRDSTIAESQEIEDWVKTEIAVSEELNSMPDIVQMIKLKQTTKSGALRIMVALLNEAGDKF